MTTFTFASYALFKGYMRNSRDAYSECLHKDDQNLQCFFSGATWDFYALKYDRPEIFQKKRTLAFTRLPLMTPVVQNPLQGKPICCHHRYLVRCNSFSQTHLFTEEILLF